MDYIKRSNLSFDLRKPDHEKVYKLINGKSLKTEYVIEAVLEYEERHSVVITKEFIKEALVEALKDVGIYNIGIQSKQEKLINKEEEIPDEIFDVFDKM